MLAALGAKGETVIHNSAREPEIVDRSELSQLLRSADKRRGDIEDRYKRAGPAAWSLLSDYGRSDRGRDISYGGSGYRGRITPARGRKRHSAELNQISPFCWMQDKAVSTGNLAAGAETTLRYWQNKDRTLSGIPYRFTAPALRGYGRRGRADKSGRNDL